MTDTAVTASGSDDSQVIDSGDADNAVEVEGPTVDSQSVDTSVLPSEPDSESADEGDPDLLRDEADDVEDEFAAAAPGEAETATAETKPATTPFTFRGDKQTHTLEGAVVAADGSVTIAASAVPKLKQDLAAAVTHNGTWQQTLRQKDSEIAELREGRTEKDVASDAVLALFDGLEDMDEDQIFEWATNFKSKAPQHRLDIREKQIAHREKQIAKRTAPDPEVVQAQTREVFDGTVNEAFETVFADAAFSGLSEADKKELREEWGSRYDLLFRRADRDMPEHDVKKGEVYFDGTPIERAARSLARVRKEATEAARKAVEVSAANKRRLGNPAALPPAANAGSRVAEPVGAAASEQPRDAATGKFKSREEWEEWRNS